LVYFGVFFIFLLFILNDLNQLHHNYSGLRLLFPIGILLLIGLSIYAVVISPVSFTFSWPIRLLTSLLSFLNFVLLIYTLFFALPVKETFVEGSKQPLCTTGVYHICRHPGFWFLAGVYLFAGLSFGKLIFLYLGLMVSICNFIYIYIQDQYIFPKLFEGYTQYQKNTAFIIPYAKRSK